MRTVRMRAKVLAIRQRRAIHWPERRVLLRRRLTRNRSASGLAGRTVIRVHDALAMGRHRRRLSADRTRLHRTLAGVARVRERRMLGARTLRAVVRRHLRWR